MMTVSCLVFVVSNGVYPAINVLRLDCCGVASLVHGVPCFLATRARRHPMCKCTAPAVPLPKYDACGHYAKPGCFDTLNPPGTLF